MPLLGKQLKVVATSAFDAEFPPDAVNYFFQIITRQIQKYPYDMLSVEHKDGKLTVRLAGYPLEGMGDLNETKVIFEETTKPFKTFWFKTDEIETGYVGTFLFPEDY